MGCSGLRLFSYDLGIVMDNYINNNPRLVSIIEKSFILRFYPIDIYRARKNFESDKSYHANVELLMLRYQDNTWFNFFLVYLIKTPRFSLGLLTPLFFLIGKFIGGDFQSLIKALKIKFKNFKIL